MDSAYIFGIAAAMVGIGFSVVYTVFGYKGLGLGSRYLKQQREGPAEALLRERYSRGELSKAEYEDMLRELRETSESGKNR